MTDMNMTPAPGSDDSEARCTDVDAFFWPIPRVKALATQLWAQMHRSYCDRGPSPDARDTGEL